MKKKKWLVFYGIFLLSFCLCLGISGNSIAGQEFSAQIKITQPEETYYFDYFVKDHFYRLEGEDSSGEPMIIIANQQEDSYIGMHPIMKFYMELSREEIFLFNPLIGWEMITEGYEEEKTGTEVIAGIECEKYVYIQPGMSEPVAEAWYSPELNHRLKIVIPLIDSGQSTFELLNIQVGSQDEEKFRIPEDYERMTSAEEQAQAETDTQDTSTVMANKIGGEAPIGRTLNSGIIMRVQTNPSLEKNLVIENRGDTDTSFTVTPFRAGESISNQIIEKTLTPKGKTKPSYSSGLKVDEIEVKVNGGTVRTTVLQESHFADEIERQEYYLFENFGQGLFFSDDRLIHMTIIGDSESSDISQLEITLFKGEYQDPIEKLEISLPNGEIRQWAFQPGEVKTADIVTGDFGGVKLILEQLPI